ncbi:cap binding protein 80-PB [Cylindrobasidium torrendii FP15055 ss-10]|uniref:Cap binding protein 80-PB n=1 Tax=Cylindrobasidium torrendii FP15055 ss-10 TaxID=1314674 RepID=A0A0D7BGY7_9AGAR|nr:cap binding protein 80-PB [Cylindrobasidium torrendii FP15055 ss-10]
MSWNRHGGGGGGRRRRDDYDRREREPPETPSDRLRSAIFRMGEVDPVEEVPQVEEKMRVFFAEESVRGKGVEGCIQFMAETLRYGVTEQPFKVPHYAALLRRLHDIPAGVQATEDDEKTSADEKMGEKEDAQKDEPSLGRRILEEYWRGFQTYVDQLAWRETRLCIRFFAHLALTRIISADSFNLLLQSFTAVLDEFGVSLGRAKKAALCAGEGLLIAGSVLPPSAVSTIIGSIDAYSESTAHARYLANTSTSLSSATVEETADELIDALLAACRSLENAEFSSLEAPFPRPYSKYDDFSGDGFVIPAVLVPPEAMEESGSEEEAPVRKDEWPEYFVRLFDNDVTPDIKTPAGYAIRTDLIAILDVFEVNRKECARLLLEYPKWTLEGSFKPKPGAPVQADPVPGKDWQLESTIIESILGAYFVLPEPTMPPVYYMSVITELCKLSPQTIGPAVGKSIRKLYSTLGDGLDVEISRRFAEWFALHMSNFNFLWVWKEWLPDLELDVAHPRRAYMRRAVSYEIRLAYYERIVKTLPDRMGEEDAFTVPKRAPGPVFPYEDPEHPFYEGSQAVLGLIRGRAKPEEAIEYLETLKGIVETADPAANVQDVVLTIVVQSLLSVGSRSFSHLLNAIERYLPLLRHLVASGGRKDAVLTAVASFWQENSQMVVIVFDKLMQYQIVDTTEVIGWVFTDGAAGGGEEPLGRTKGTIGELGWSLVHAALSKANGRVNVARKRMAALRKEDDDTRARAIAVDAPEGPGFGDGADVKNEESADMDVDGIKKENLENPALATATKAFDSLVKEQRGGLARALEGFGSILVPSGEDEGSQAMKKVSRDEEWEQRGSWGKAEWHAWESWGWYRHFCRVYSPYLRTYAATLSTVSFASFDGSTEATAVLVKKMFNSAIGSD